MGDRVLLAVTPGSWVKELDELTQHAADGVRWHAVETRIWGGYALVVLESQGNDAAFVVLRKREDGYCVRAMWGYSFGGLGVDLQTTSVSSPRAETVLVTLAATATYNNPVDDVSDPFANRRIALAVGESQGLVLADSMLSATFAPYSRDRWYFEHEVLVIVHGDRLQRWRFDLTSGQPSRKP